jgi:hypothetical protein
MTGKIGAAFVLLASIGAASLSGCGGSCHDDVFFTWTIVDQNNTVFKCEDVGAKTVVITMSGMSTSFDCALYKGETAAVRAGTYDTSFQLLDAAGKVLSQTDAKSVTVSGCGTIDIGQIDFEICGTQDVSLSWSIVQNVTNAPLTCQQVGAGTVRLNLGNSVFNFDCNAGVGRTAPVSEGTYTTTVQLFDLNSQLLSETNPAMNVTVPHCAGVTLPDITFGVQ